MASQLKDELCCIGHCLGDYEQNSIVNSVSVGDWAAECAIIASNESESLAQKICAWTKMLRSVFPRHTNMFGLTFRYSSSNYSQGFCYYKGYIEKMCIG